MKSKIIILVLLFLLFISIGFVFYYYKKSKSAIITPVSQTTQIDNTIQSLSKLILLPSDDEPTIATITDVSKLSDQPFFALAKNQDKLIVYPKTKLAILYRPDENIIINVAPLYFENQNNSALTNE